jgi:hypothetical protein
MEHKSFDESLVKNYPQSRKKISVDVKPYSLLDERRICLPEEKGITTYVSPYGLEFQVDQDYANGTLLKIFLSIPGYWDIKKSMVDYQRIDSPDDFSILARVIRVEEVGKRKKKKSFLCETLNIDEIDEKILKSFLEGS